jgi:branched-chain amino acid transport system substrate-binding protein
MNRNRIGCALSVIGALGLGCGEDSTPMTPPPPGDPIHVRTMTNLTGATSENAHPYYLGIKDAIAEANETGGIRNHKIEEKTRNHDYMQAMWVAAYDDLKANDPDFAKVIQFFSWGTPDTQAFSKDATMREVPWISGSYATTLATPLPQTRMVAVPPSTDVTTFTAEGAPYNFFAGTDYSTQVRIAMDFVKKRLGTKIAFAYCTGSSFCKEPIPPGKTYGKQIGLTILSDMNFELGDNYDTVDLKVKAYAENPANAGVEWFWVGNSIFSSTHFAKAVRKYYPTNTPKLIMNLYGMDERTGDLCGADCVGNAFSVQAFANYGDLSREGMAEVLRVATKWRAKDTTVPEATWKNIRYVQGYVSFFVFRKAVEKLIDEKKELTGKNLKVAYESFRNLSTGGLTPPISFTAEDHRPTNITRIYSMNAQGKLLFEDEISIALQSEWLGW